MTAMTSFLFTKNAVFLFSYRKCQIALQLYLFLCA